MEDKKLQCKECGDAFLFTEREQAFYKENGFENDPQRCPTCRAQKKQQRREARGGFGGGTRKMYSVTCSSCGKDAQVPFQPTGDKPVFCRECYQSQSR